MDASGKYSGTVFGVMNMAGNFGGAMSHLLFGAGTSWLGSGRAG
jgi:hypothetical protein